MATVDWRVTASTVRRDCATFEERCERRFGSIRVRNGTRQTQRGSMSGSARKNFDERQWLMHHLCRSSLCCLQATSFWLVCATTRTRRPTSSSSTRRTRRDDSRRRESCRTRRKSMWRTKSERERTRISHSTSRTSKRITSLFSFPRISSPLSPTHAARCSNTRCKRASLRTLAIVADVHSSVSLKLGFTKFNALLSLSLLEVSIALAKCTLRGSKTADCMSCMRNSDDKTARP